MSRIVAQFSCGAASAVATKLALAQYGATHDVQIINAFLMEEHEDNRRFATDCEDWFGQSINVLRDTKYGGSTIQVFKKRQYMKGPMGAPCSRALKRDLLDGWKQDGDIMVFGYTAEEADRLEDFRDRNPDRPVLAPLIERGLTKGDCKEMVSRAGIVLPAMYLLGYDNANCIGCVKGARAIGARSAKTSRCNSRRIVLCKTRSAPALGSCAIAPARAKTSAFRCATSQKARLPETRNCHLARSSARWPSRSTAHEHHRQGSSQRTRRAE